MGLLSRPSRRRSARFVNWHDKRFVSLVGEVHLKRAYYHCHASQVPWNLELAVGHRDLAPAAAEVVTLTWDVENVWPSRRTDASENGGPEVERIDGRADDQKRRRAMG